MLESTSSFYTLVFGNKKVIDGSMTTGHVKEGICVLRDCSYFFF